MTITTTASLAASVLFATQEFVLQLSIVFGVVEVHYGRG